MKPSERQTQQQHSAQAERDDSVLQLPKLLAYLGLLPFIGLTICRYLGVFQLPFGLHTNEALSSYALIIITFMAAIHWGQSSILARTNVASAELSDFPRSAITALFLLSNAITLVAWFSYLLVITFSTLLYIDVVLFGVILLIDWYLYQKHIISRAYIRFRIWITLGVVICLLLSALTASGL